MTHGAAGTDLLADAPRHRDQTSELACASCR